MYTFKIDADGDQFTLEELNQLLDTDFKGQFTMDDFFLLTDESYKFYKGLT